MKEEEVQVSLYPINENSRVYSANLYIKSFFEKLFIRFSICKRLFFECNHFGPGLA